MSMINNIFKYAEKYIVAFEVPPGIGKTVNMIGKALELASRGNIVIFALPNHNALLTAFAYAIHVYSNLIKKMPRRKLPYLIYYEGINRFCPFFSKNGNELFRKALDYMVKKGFVDKVLYERIKDLNVHDIAYIYGSMFICRYLCPVYKLQKHFEHEKIFVTQNVKKTSEDTIAFLGEEKSYVTDALAKLGKLESQKLVAYISPKVNENGEPDGYCLRSILQKAVKGKTQLVMKGAVILTPIQAVDFIHAIIESRIKVLRARGFPLPYPYVIFDEYDFYIYRPSTIPLFTVRYAEKEMEIAREIIRDEMRKRVNGDPSYDWEKLVAATIAYLTIQRIIQAYKEFEKEAKTRTTITPAGSIANMFIEAVSEPVIGSGLIIPPFAPRKIILSTYKNLPFYIFDKMEKEHEKVVKKYGVSLFVLDDVKKMGLKYFYDLWENILVVEGRKRGLKFPAPALYRLYGKVYDIGYIYIDKIISFAKTVAKIILMTKRDHLTLYYRFIVTRRKILKEKNGKEKVVSEGGGFVVKGVYDPKFYKLFAANTESKIILMSATGLPWYSPFYVTRAMGEGMVTYRGKQTSSSLITTAFKGYKFREGADKNFTYLSAQGVYIKPILAISLNPSALLGYTSHGVIYAVEKLSILPPKGKGDRYLVALMDTLSHYVNVTSELVREIIKNKVDSLKKHPAILVLTQRKDVAAVYVWMVASEFLSRKRRVEINVCKSTKCKPLGEAVKEAKRKLVLNDIIELISEKGYSHLVLKIKMKKGEEFRIYTTWLRSKMSRGIDLPDDTVAYAVLMIGSPYRPPESFDIVPRPGTGLDAVTRSSFIAIRIFVKSPDFTREVVFAHNPIDIAESVNEFVQAVGRALRRAWAITRANRMKKLYNVIIVIPAFTRNKIFNFSPLWFRETYARY